MTLPWHRQAFSILEQMIDQNHLPHALLITGCEEMGKFELMQELVSTLTGQKEKIQRDNIKQDIEYPALIRRSNYQNMIYCRAGEINENTKNISKEIRIDQIRAFCDALNKTSDDLQIGVIFYADQMNVSAANSLLKTLEEPRVNTLIILLAHDAKNLPATVVSRCQSVHISPSYDQQTQDWLLEHISKTQKADFDVKKLLENTHGVPFKVLKELSNDDYIHYQNWQNQLLDIAIHPTKINQLNDFDGNENGVLNCLQNIVIEGIKLKILEKEGGLVELNDIVSKVKSAWLFKILDDIYFAISLLKTTVNARLLLDNILIVWSHITHLKQYPQITYPQRRF